MENLIEHEQMTGRRIEASDDDDVELEHEKHENSRRIDSRVSDSGESDEQGAAAEYEDEIEEEDNEVDLVVDDSVSVDAIIGENVNGNDEEETKEDENEAFVVPTGGAFYMHDDRFRDNSGSGGGRGRQTLGGKKPWESRDDKKWGHDKFEETNMQERPYNEEHGGDLNDAILAHTTEGNKNGNMFVDSVSGFRDGEPFLSGPSTEPDHSGRAPTIEDDDDYIPASLGAGCSDYGIEEGTILAAIKDLHNGQGDDVVAQTSQSQLKNPELALVADREKELLEQLAKEPSEPYSPQVVLGDPPNDVDTTLMWVHWLHDQQDVLQIETKTLFAAVHLFYRFLSIEPVNVQFVSHIAVVAMRVAIKFHETGRNPKKSTTMIELLRASGLIKCQQGDLDKLINSVSDQQGDTPTNSPSDKLGYVLDELAYVLDLEKRMCEKVNWIFDSPVFLSLFNFLDDANENPDDEMEEMAYFFAKLGTENDLLVKYGPQLLAAAAFHRACKTLKRKVVWQSRFTEEQEHEVNSCSRAMMELYRELGDPWRIPSNDQGIIIEVSDVLASEFPGSSAGSMVPSA